VRKGRKVHIALTLDESLLDTAYCLARELGINRFALLSLALRQPARSGIHL
jgi:hypothetical protein